MDTEVIADRVTQLLIQRLGLPPETVHATARLADDLGMDSVDSVEFALALEREFQTPIPDEVLTDVKTVEDVIGTVRVLMNRYGVATA